MARETRSRFTDVITPGLFAVMTEEYKRYPETWRELVNVKKSTNTYEECSYLTGLGMIPKMPEGTGVVYDARIQAYKKRWTHDTWGGGLRITQEAIEEDRYDVMESGSRELGVSARETRHVRVASIWNTGFGTTEHVAGDTLAIFSASHPKLAGGLWSNLATASNLSYSVLQSMIMAYENQTDHRNKKIIQTPMILLVAPANEFKALELLRSIGIPESAQNEPNAVRLARPRLRMIVWPYLTASNATFLHGDNARMETGLIYFERIGVTFAKEGDFDTGDAKFKVRWRDSVEVNNPIGMYGNAGL